MAVAADTDVLTPPCGACRQILWEFCGDVEIVLVNLRGKTETLPIERTVPEAIRCFVSLAFFLFASAARCAAEPADWIWSARYVITEDAQHRVIENGAVAIRGDRIVGVGTKAEIDARFQAKQRLDRPDAILAPGLINTHTHAAMSLFRGIADDLKLQDWLEKFIFPAEAKNVSRGVRPLGHAAGLPRNAAGRHHHVHRHVLLRGRGGGGGQRSRHARRARARPSSASRWPTTRRPPTRWSFTEKYLTRFRNDPLIVPAVAPHALYTNSDETLKASRALANKYNAPLIIHLSETKKENDDALAQRHMTPTKVLDSLGVFNGRTVAAHCVWVDEADMAILKQRGVGVAHCPSSNMKLASGVAPVIADAGARHGGRARARRSGGQQQRLQSVRGDGPGRQTAEGDDR